MSAVLEAWQGTIDAVGGGDEEGGLEEEEIL